MGLELWFPMSNFQWEPELTRGDTDARFREADEVLELWNRLVDSELGDGVLAIHDPTISNLLGPFPSPELRKYEDVTQYLEDRRTVYMEINQVAKEERRYSEVNWELVQAVTRRHRALLAWQQYCATQSKKSQHEDPLLTWEHDYADQMKESQHEDTSSLQSQFTLLFTVPRGFRSFSQHMSGSGSFVAGSNDTDYLTNSAGYSTAPPSSHDTNAQPQLLLKD